MTSDKRSKTEPKPTSASSGLPDPTERERADIVAACRNHKKRSPPVRMTIQETADGRVSADASHSDGRGWLLVLADKLGSSSAEFALEQLNFLMRATKADLAPADKMTAVNSMLAAVAGVQPQNETEGALAVQMAATHHLAMMFLERAKQAQHMPMFESNGNMAVKLLRTYTAQVEALAKLRRGGNQTVRVEHVHVHSGGQAIVGNVAHPGGGGVVEQTADQPHAPGGGNEETRRLTAESVAPVWSKDSKREPVPVARGEGAEQVPDAWGRKG